MASSLDVVVVQPSVFPVQSAGVAVETCPSLSVSGPDTLSPPPLPPEFPPPVYLSLVQMVCFGSFDPIAMTELVAQSPPHQLDQLPSLSPT
jgi:hypothetical protein